MRGPSKAGVRSCRIPNVSGGLIFVGRGGERVYQALYRKWRPRTFDEVVGQPHITETLKRQVATGRLSHAYLFTGTRGTGKTTCAKILARAVNCEHPVDGNPCNACPACLGIENGSILDVLELDAASNNGVDQIRALRDEAAYTPAAVRKRVYIVDEVHMLSTAAFNALLKILEEPPAHLMFILATTELHKVPATIKSRCQQFAFKRISPKALAGRLDYVARQEGIPLSTPAAELLARLADGGLRDGLSLLDQCSGAEGELNETVVLDVLGLAGNRRTAELLDCVAREDTAGALEALDGLYRDGKDMGALLGELAALVRDLLIRKTAPEGGQGLLTGGYEERTIRQLLQRFTSGELVQIMTLLQRAQAELYRSSSRRFDVELCLIRLCDRRLSGTEEGILSRLSRLEEQLSQGSIPIQQEKIVSPPEENASSKEPIPAEETPPWVPVSPQEEEETFVFSEEDVPPWEDAGFSSGPFDVPALSPDVKMDREKKMLTANDEQRGRHPSEEVPSGQWPAFLATLRDLPPMVHSFLHKPESVTGTFEERTLTLWVDSELTKGFLSRGDTPSLLERAAEAYLGQPRRVVFKVGKPEPAERRNPSASQALSHAEVQTPPEGDKFDDLLALGRQFGNFTVK